MLVFFLSCVLVCMGAYGALPPACSTLALPPTAHYFRATHDAEIQALRMQLAGVTAQRGNLEDELATLGKELDATKKDMAFRDMAQLGARTPRSARRSMAGDEGRRGAPWSTEGFV